MDPMPSTDEQIGQMPSTDEQIGQVWRGMMGAMTTQGATREQIAEVACRTAQTIIDLTGSALWPDTFRDALPARSWPQGEARWGNGMEDAWKALQEAIYE